MENYYFNKVIDSTFENAIEKVTEALKIEGFGIMTSIDVKETMKQKLNTDFRNYRILGACNPPYALQALTAEDKIGTMLPCNVIIQELEPGKIEVAAIDPIASMQAVKNPLLGGIALEIQSKLKKVVDSL